MVGDLGVSVIAGPCVDVVFAVCCVQHMGDVVALQQSLVLGRIPCVETAI